MSEWPAVWTKNILKDRLASDPWLIGKDGSIGCSVCKENPPPQIMRGKGASVSKEWTSISVKAPSHQSRKQQLKTLRKKILKHSSSASHTNAIELSKRISVNSETAKQLEHLSEKQETSTEHVFRLAYLHAKLDRPYKDFPHHITCHTLNGADMGRILHSEKACQNIINSVSSDMKKVICKDIIEHQSKITVMVDESTSVSVRTCMVIHIRALVNEKPTNVLLDIVEVPKTDAATILDSILATLDSHGFSEEYRQKHLTCFASDGASNMCGHTSGVGALLLKKYPDIILWHCANHRLELSVGDVAKDVAGVNPLHIFIDSLYSTYSQSPKSYDELKECAAELDTVLKKLGRILDTRWAASSLRAVKSIWDSYPALAAHFGKPHSNNRAKFEGLRKTFTSTQFLSNLALMYDALKEVSNLSLALQKRSVGLVESHQLINQTIRAVEYMIDHPGKYLSEALEAVEEGKFKAVDLHSGKVQTINARQFFRSLNDNLKNRMLTVASRRGEKASQRENNQAEYQSLLSQVSVTDSSRWPPNFDDIPMFGEGEISEIATRFHLDVISTVVAFKVYKAMGGRDLPPELKAIKSVLSIIPISTAECERSFSVMNNVLTGKRNQLTIPNLSCLMFISIMGPPLTLFRPKQYVKNWVKRGRHTAVDTNSKTRVGKQVDPEMVHLYNLL